MRRQANALTALSAVAAMVMGLGVALTAADRLSDRDLKALFEAVDEARDRFEDQLDGKLKNGIVRSPRGETKVDDYLNDFQEDVKNLRERFSDKYAASQEATVVLQKGTAMRKFLDGYDKQIKGRSEFDRLASELDRVAAAYGVAFPLADGATPRRYNDAEVQGIVESLAEDANLLKKAIDADKTLPKQTRAQAKTQLDDFRKQANTVKSRVGDGKPASAEARDLLGRITRLGEFVGGKPLSSGATAAWGSIRSKSDALRQAFGE
jgi:hypothetical protein